MTSRTARLKAKGQITIPVELRRKFDLEPGARVLFEDRGDYIAVLPQADLVARTAGLFADRGEGSPVEFDRDEVWTEMTRERYNRLQDQWELPRWERDDDDHR